MDKIYIYYRAWVGQWTLDMDILYNLYELRNLDNTTFRFHILCFYKSLILGVNLFNPSLFVRIEEKEILKERNDKV